MSCVSSGNLQGGARWRRKNDAEARDTGSMDPFRLAVIKYAAADRCTISLPQAVPLERRAMYREDRNCACHCSSEMLNP